MGKELLSIHVGQAGVQMGHAYWELIAQEHCIQRDGHAIPDGDLYDLQTSNLLFQATSKGLYVPRSVMVDLEPTVIDEIRTGYYRGLFHADSLINGIEDAANNFARGFFTVGNLIVDKITDELRRQIENCDRLQGIQFFRALGGGTGSGLTASLFDFLSEFSSKCTKVEIPIYPSPSLTSSTVEPINTILGEHFTMDDIDISMLLDNEALFDIYKRNLEVKSPTLHDINKLVAQVVSCFSAGTRFRSFVNNDITTMQTNLCPYPRIHFPMCSISPVSCHKKSSHETNTTIEITTDVFKKCNALVKIDPSQGKYMSCSLTYRGQVYPDDVAKALNNLKNSSSIRFVDWVPTAFKVGIIDKEMVNVTTSKMPAPPRNVTMFTNNSCVGNIFQHIVHRFHILFSKRAFIHWFVGEGLEEVEFSEALLNIANLVKDYEECSKDTLSTGELVPEQENVVPNGGENTAPASYNAGGAKPEETEEAGEETEASKAEPEQEAAPADEPAADEAEPEPEAEETPADDEPGDAEEEVD